MVHRRRQKISVEVLKNDLVCGAEPLVEVLLDSRNLGQVDNALEVSVPAPSLKNDKNISS